MRPATSRRLLALTALAGAAILSACALAPAARQSGPEIGFVQLSPDITLRRLVAHSPQPRGTVLLLHGFPETLYAWSAIYPQLSKDYEVHAFDWPGYGQSTKPTSDRFSYSPRDYAKVLTAYIRKANIDTRTLTIYATDIGALPVLLAALDDPSIAKSVIVGDFAPLNRPQYMAENLQALKTQSSSEAVRAALNKNRDEILENAFRRGLPKEEQFELAQQFKDDMFQGWTQGQLTTADAFSNYYTHFTRDQEYLETNLARLRTPVKVVWGEKDFYIKKEMGIEFAKKAGLEFEALPKLGHYPHLQAPEQTIAEVRDTFKRQ